MSAKHEYMVDYTFKRKQHKDDFGWHRRGYLPHVDSEEFTEDWMFSSAWARRLEE